jgi:hypothetical protein
LSVEDFADTGLKPNVPENKQQQHEAFDPKI